MRCDAERQTAASVLNRMEGAGMRPDREVLLTLADLRAGVDRDLEVAKEWIRQRAQRIAEEH